MTPVRPAYQYYRILWQSLDWLFPPKCGGCGRMGKRWCDSCDQLTHCLPSPVCQSCGIPIGFGNLCRQCEGTPTRYKALRSYTEFSGPVRNALNRLKYKHDIALGECLAKMLIVYYESLNWKMDLIIPVPLGVARLQNRGYNQAALLARPLALATGIYYQPQALQRIKDTPTQVGLSASKRKSNVLSAFRADEEYVRGKNVLIVDDVATSGATVDACADALLHANAASVYCLTLARTI